MGKAKTDRRHWLKKSVKWLLIITGWLLAIVLVAVLTLPLWIGPVAVRVANRVVPGITKTHFQIGDFALNPYTGRMRVSDLQLWNPERFWREDVRSSESEGQATADTAAGKVFNLVGQVVDSASGAARALGNTLASSETNAVSFSSFSIDIDVPSVCSKTVRIREIELRDLYVYGDLTFANIREIAKAASGGSQESESELAPETATPSEPAPGPASDGASQGGGKRVVVERLIVTGAKIQWGRVAVPLPDILITNIGEGNTEASTSGASWDEVWQAAVDGVCAAADEVCIGAGKALKLALEGGEAAAAAIGEVLDGVGSATGTTVEGVNKAVGAAAEGVGKAADKVLKFLKK